MMTFGQSSRVFAQRALRKHTSITRLSGSGVFRYFSAASGKTVADGRRPKMVILGSGWASCNTIQNLGKDALKRYDITVVSPTNYYVYTPMLPSVTVGTLEPRSIVEPVRHFISERERKCADAKIVFTEAEAVSIDSEKKRVRCVDASPRTPVTAEIMEAKPKKWRSSLSGAMYATEQNPDGSFYEYEFEIPYDVLVLGVGATTNTFGTPGAMDHCLFLKSISDALQIRSAVVDCFETATVAKVSKVDPKELERLLSFVVVGAGPTGVEMAAELRDFIKDNLLKTYPHFKDHKIQVQIIEMGDRLLNTYDKAISEYTLKRFFRHDINVLTKHQVKKVNAASIEVMDLATKKLKVIPFGMCVWASGVRPVDISLDLAKTLGTRMLETDGWLRVRGAEGEVFALGDCAKITVPSMRAAAKDLFAKADTNNDGVLSEDEFVPMMEAARNDYPHMEAYLGAVSDRTLSLLYDSAAKGPDGGITPQAFEQALAEIDSEIKMLPPTAQVAAQQGTYLGKMLSEVPFEKLGEDKNKIAVNAFKYNHQGSMAYIGAERAVIDSPQLGVLKGLMTALMWKGAYWGKSVSIRCKVLMAFDWLKVHILGRDTSRL